MQSAKKWQQHCLGWPGRLRGLATKICCGFVKRAATQKTNRSGNKSLTEHPPLFTSSPPLLMTHILLNECHIAGNGMRDAAAALHPRHIHLCVAARTLDSRSGWDSGCLPACSASLPASQSPLQLLLLQPNQATVKVTF